MNYQSNTLTQKIKKIDFSTIYICLFIIIILKFFTYRIVRGADMTDETFYATLAYRLAKGNHLLADMWEQCSTAAVLPSLLLKIRQLFTGNLGGAIVIFFRLSFLMLNLGASILLFFSQKNYLSKKYTVLLTLFYFIYSPFHMYTFSYNHLSDVLIMLIINVTLLAIETHKTKLLLIAGILCAFLAFTYPTMLFLCPILTLLLFLKRKTIKKGWIYFMIGGISFAALTLIILLSTIGISGILIGIKGILSDPAYNVETIPIGKKIFKAFQYLFTPVLGDRSLIIKIYFGWLFIVFLLKKKFPVLKLSIGLYPIIICFALLPIIQPMEALAEGMFIFYLSILCPFLWLFTEKHKKLFFKFLYFEWLPVMLFYLVISVSSFGAAVQAVQGLFIASLVMLKETIFIINETFEELALKKINVKICGIKLWVTILVLCTAVFGEMYINYNIVYRDGHVRYLTEKIETGPYRGIYTTIERKIYLEEMTRLLEDIQEENKSACVLYQSNFAYLMLDMIPATPTTWGIYPHMNNQDVYYEYFKLGKEHIPETIYIVNVPEMYNYCGQREEYYEFCTQIKSLITDNYILTEEISIYETGSIKKYILISDETKFLQNLELVY